MTFLRLASGHVEGGIVFTLLFHSDWTNSSLVRCSPISNPTDTTAHFKARKFSCYISKNCFLESSCSFQKQRVALDAQMSTLYKMSCCFLQAWILSPCVSCGSVLEQHLLRRRRGPSFTNLPQCYTWYRRIPLEGRWPPEPLPPHAAPTAHVAASARRRRCCYSALNTTSSWGWWEINLFCTNVELMKVLTEKSHVHHQCVKQINPLMNDCIYHVKKKSSWCL